MRWEFSIFCVLDNMGSKVNWREHIRWLNTVTRGLPYVTTLQDNHVKDANEVGAHLNASGLVGRAKTLYQLTLICS